MKNLLIAMMILVSAMNAKAQIVNNGGFEGTPQAHTVPAGWLICNMTPDTQPGIACIDIAPKEGDSYLGLALGKTLGAEITSQELNISLEPGVEYKISANLCEFRKSCLSGYDLKSAHLRIYAGDSICKMQKLIWESDSVGINEWNEYEGLFTIDTVLSYITLVVHSETATFKYVLIDDLKIYSTTTGLAQNHENRPIEYKNTDKTRQRVTLSTR